MPCLSRFFTLIPQQDQPADVRLTAYLGGPGLRFRQASHISVLSQVVSVDDSHLQGCLSFGPTLDTTIRCWSNEGARPSADVLLGALSVI